MFGKQKDLFFAKWQKVKKDVVYILIILNIIIWAVSYQSTKNFYNEYIQLQYEALAKEEVVSEKSDTNLQPLVKDKEWALDQWEVLGGKKLRDKANLVFFMESGIKEENAHNCNSDGSVDLGFYQFNSVHIPKRLTIECAGSIECSTNKAIELYKEQGWCPWVQAKKLGYCK